MKLIPPSLLLFAWLLAIADISASSVFEAFTVTTRSALVNTYTKTSLMLESKSPTYAVKLEPNTEGAVMFSLGRYGYRSTLLVDDLAFGVRIEGFKDGQMVSPVFNLDDGHEEVVVEGNFVKFQRIVYGAIPVFFDAAVDSITLHFSNSHSLDVHQHLTITDLQVVQPHRLNANPVMVDCDKHSIMIALDGSASIDKKERKTIAKQLMGFFKRPPEVLDSNAVCIMEFGRQVRSVSESVEKKEIVKDLRGYKKGKAAPKKRTGYTNWSAAFDQAIVSRPDIFIFITDRWSNYSEDGPASFNAQYQTLIEKCNILKSYGTRLLFITSGLNTHGDANPTLYSMLDQHNTNEIIGVDLTGDVDLKQVDLISMDGFETFERIDLTSLLECGELDGVAMESSEHP